MATTKKASTTKKTSVKKTTTTKKAAPARKQTVVRTHSAGSASSSFFTFRWNQETVYWLILSMAILALGVWVMSLTDQVHTIYDQIEDTQSSTDSIRTAR